MGYAGFAGTCILVRTSAGSISLILQGMSVGRQAVGVLEDRHFAAGGLDTLFHGFGHWTRSARADVGTRCMYLGNVDRECCYSSFMLRSTAACMHRKFRPECLCSTPHYIHCGTASVKHIQDQACAAPLGGLVPVSLPVCVWCHSMALKCMWIWGGKIISKVRVRLT